MTVVRVRVRGLDEALKYVRDAKAKLDNLEPVMRVAAEKLKSISDATFRTQSAPDGTEWAPLKPATLKQKERLGFSPLRLVRHGARGLQGGTTFEGRRNGIRIGTSPLTPYAAYHQDGTSRIPRTAFLPLEGPANARRLMQTPAVAKVIAELAVDIRRFVFGERR